MKKRWIPFIAVAAMISISSIATADETEMDFYISEDDSEEVLVAAAEEDEDPFAVDGLIEDLEAADGKTGAIPIDETHFPDEYFRKTVSISFDLPDSEGNKDGVLSEEEIAAVTTIKLQDSSIKSLEGIEHFAALKKLICSRCTLTNLDVSKCTSLEYLSCGINSSFDSLDVSHNTKLTYLSCWNAQVKTLDVSHNTELEYLGCSYNELTNLDVSHNTKLKTLDCYDNHLSSLDVSNNKNLAELDCFNNQLTSLKLGKTTNLYHLDCSYNQLKQLDISGHRYLIDAYKNGVVTIDNNLIAYRRAEESLTLDKNVKVLITEGNKVSQPSEKITITKKPTIQKPAATKNKITVKWKHFKHTSKKTKAIWKKIKKVQVQCATDKAFKNIVKTTTVGKGKTKATIKGLQKKTTYYVRVRYYDGAGYSAWSKAKKIKTKK